MPDGLALQLVEVIDFICLSFDFWNIEVFFHLKMGFSAQLFESRCVLVHWGRKTVFICGQDSCKAN